MDLADARRCFRSAFGANCALICALVLAEDAGAGKVCFAAKDAHQERFSKLRLTSLNECVVCSFQSKEGPRVPWENLEREAESELEAFMIPDTGG